jgi:hypothetical protein
LVKRLVSTASTAPSEGDLFMLAKLDRLTLAVIGQTGERWAYPGTISAVGLIPRDEALSVKPLLVALVGGVRATARGPCSPRI